MIYRRKFLTNTNQGEYMSLKKSLLSVALVFAMGGAANAAPISDVVTATADVAFSSTVKASISLTPKTDLTPDTPMNSIIATGSASAVGGAAAIRWTPGTGSILLNQGKHTTIEISGKNNPQNKLRANISVDGVTLVENDGWVMADNSASTLPFNVAKYSSNSPADTYTLSVDAVVWGA